MTKSATCALDEIAISDASVEVPAVRDHDRAAVLRRVADDRDDDERDEELREADRVREGVERVDEDLADQRRDRGRGAERDERALQAPRVLVRFFPCARRGAAAGSRTSLTT